MLYEKLAPIFSRSSDYSPEFTENVKRLKNILGKITGVQIIHDDDMNYSAAQTLTFVVDQFGNPANENIASGKVVLFISSKANVFVYLYYSRLGKNSWGPPDLTGDKKISTLENIASIFSKNSGCQFLTENLHKEVDGHETDLDGKPATAFEILFSEVY